jgi:transposase-like protein
MLTDKSPELLNEIVEVDENYVGGSESNKHKHKRVGQGNYGNKTMVLGAIQRKGKVKVKVIAKTTTEEVTAAIREFIAPNSTMVTDEHHAYKKLSLEYNHKSVNHRDKEYVRKGDDILIHTNNIEGYWNILKKQIDGIHHSVSPKHLQRYCNENAFRFNHRLAFQDERFADALANCNGSLKYKILTEENEK